jgi:hypothetical protein
MTRRPPPAVIPRRPLLGGLAAAAATPLLASLFDPRRARAAAAPTPPRRLLVWGHLEGNISKTWSPPATADGGFELSEVLKPLEPWKSRLLVIDGLHDQSGIDASKKGVDAHAAAVSGMLTGRADTVQRPAVSPRTSASIDQFVADKLRGAARLRSMEMRVDAASVAGINVNYPLQGGPPLGTPSGDEAHFDRLFGDLVGADTPAGRRAWSRRASVLDHVTRDLESLRRVAGRESARNVEAHLAAIRDIERRLSWKPAASCTVPARPTNIGDRNRIPEATRLRLDMIAQAFACDVVRVATLCISDTGWNLPAPFLEVSEPLHALSHGQARGGVTWAEAGKRIMRWSYEQMAYLMKALEAIPEGNGTTALDNTLILSIAEFGDSAAHSCKNLPILLIGNAGGYFKTGRCLRFSGQPHNDVLASVAEACGLPVRSFGDPALSQGPLAALRA